MSRPAAPALVVAVEGGPEGFSVALGDLDGTVLGTRSGTGADPETDGAAATAARIAALVAETVLAAGVPLPQRLRLEALGAFVSGCDLDEESDRLTEALADVVEAREVVVDDAALALLRADTPHGEGVAVRCGAVTGCAAARDGVRHRFGSLGRAGGDWGGAIALGEEALWWAARAADGRGVPTSLARLAPLAVGHASAVSAAQAIRRRELPRARLAHIAPVVLRAASAGDSVSVQLVERQAAELALTAHVALERAVLLDSEASVVLGGALVEADAGLLVEGVRQRLDQVAPHATLVGPGRPAVHGAFDLLREHLEESGRRAARVGRATGGRSVRPPA